MSVFLLLTISLLLSINLSNCCNIIRYKSNDLETIYKLEPSLKCMNNPVYKLTDKPFYIYKSANSNFWCDSFNVTCGNECTELRFDFDQLLKSQQTSITPQYFDKRFGKWFPKQTDSIACSDSLTKAELMLDDLIQKLKSFRTNLNFNNTKLDEFISNTLDSMNNKDKMKYLNELLISSNKDQIQSSFCSMIEYQIFDEQNKIKFKSNFMILKNEKCFDSPVYKSVNGLFLYKSNGGSWCKAAFNNFDSKSSCLEPCNIRLSPHGIKSPIDTKKIDIYNEETKSYDLLSNNHRFICAEYINCTTVDCLNGGQCLNTVKEETDNIKNYKCICPPQYTGVRCEYLIDSCSLNKNVCINNGTCISKPYENQIECMCDENHYGNQCQHKLDNCMKNNPCQHDSTCISDVKEGVTCICSENFFGQNCQFQKTYCKNRKFGDLVADPDSKSNFLVCLNEGHFKVKSCPTGLVWNSYLVHCDYDDKPPAHSCETNICKNGGTCERIDENYKCNCQLGFTGDHCEINVNDCENNVTEKCGPNGKCLDLVNGYVCICDDDYFGPDCFRNKVKIPCRIGIDIHTTRYFYPFDSSVIVQCNSRGNLLLNKCPNKLHWNPATASCQHDNPVNMTIGCLEKQCVHGKCEMDSNNEPKCICNNGYEGDFCENDIDECASNPCLNNSTCVNGVGHYYCICQNKFLDTDCCCLESSNPCNTVMRDINTKKDKTVRHSHPFSMEKFMVCNLEGYAQIINCPNGLIWSNEEQSCEAKSENLYQSIQEMCVKANVLTSRSLFAYPYSKLKFIQCISSPDQNFIIRDCPKRMPYFCEKTRSCVQSLSKYC